MNYRGLIYRAVDPKHWTEPLSGAGAARHAQRFNTKGVPTLYTATDPQTVLREKMQEGVLQPLLLVAIRAEMSGLFDARDEAALARFGVTPDSIGRDDWRDEAEREGQAESQRFAAAVRDAGYGGMVVPSYAQGATEKDVNIVLWNWGDGTEAKLSLVDDEGCLAPDRREPQGTQG